MKRYALLVLMALAAMAPPSAADVPRTIHYQGKLTEPDGTSLIGTHAIILRIYDASDGGSKLWEESHTIELTKPDNGIFSVVLGSKTEFPSSVSFNDSLWLTLEIDGTGEFSPRQPLAAVSYAINADQLDGVDSAKFIRNDLDATTTGKLTITRAGTALVVKPSADPAANTKLVDVQNAAGASKFSVDLEGDTVVAGSLTVSGTVSGGGVGTVSFDNVTSGTNSVATMTLASGGTLTFSGSGVVNANQFKGNTVIAVADGGTGATNAADTRTNLGAAGSGANSDITSLTGLTTPLSASQGGTGIGSYVAGDILYASATDALSRLPRGTENQVLQIVGSLPTWSTLGEVTEIGDCASGSCFTANSTSNALWFEGTSADTSENILTSDDPTGGDGTFTLPNLGGTSTVYLVVDGTSVTNLDGKGLTIAAAQLDVSCEPIGGTTTDSDNATFEMSLFGSQTGSGAGRLSPVPVAGTVDQLQARVDQAPGSGKSWAVTVRKNDANTALSCTISDSAQSCSATGAVSVAAGDRLGVQFVKSGNPAKTNGSGWSVCFVPD